MSNRSGESTSPNWWQMIWSVLAAMLGVQTEANRKRDFAANRPLPYILIGVLFIVCFVAALIIIVNVVLAST